MPTSTTPRAKPTATQETIAETIESTVKRMQAKTSPADREFEASKSAALGALDKLLEARQHFQNAASAAGMDIKEEAVDQLLAGKSKVEELGQEISEFAREKPGTTVVLAFLGGFVLAQLLSRK